MATLVVSNAFAGPETALREFAGGQIKKGVRTIGMGGDGATTGNYALVYKRPKFAAHERGMLVLLARLLPRWRDAVLLVKPETILRWHREGFRTLWRWKSKQKSPTSKLPAETIPLIPPDGRGKPPLGSRAHSRGAPEAGHPRREANSPAVHEGASTASLPASRSR